MAKRTYNLVVRRVVHVQAVVTVDTESEDYRAFAGEWLLFADLDDAKEFEDEIIEGYVEQTDWTIESSDINEEEVVSCVEVK